MEKLISVDAGARSRRNFFSNAAAMLAAAGVVGSLEAQTSGGDVDILNFALRLERLEATFYATGLTRFQQSDFAAANFAKNLSSTQVANLYQYFQAIGSHENAHVMQLSAVIPQLGGTVVAPDCYAFQAYGTDTTTFRTADNFVSVAMVLENTGVAAYDGAINLISSASLRTAAATIATVEARHASYLNLLNGVSPFPNAFDTTASATDVLTAASKFIANCGLFPPSAVAGPKNQTTSSKTGFTLDSSSSTTVDGAPVSSYLWAAQLGSNAIVNTPSSAKTTVTFNGGPGIYTFVLMITDSHGANSTDAVKVIYTGV